MRPYMKDEKKSAALLNFLACIAVLNEYAHGR